MNTLVNALAKVIAFFKAKSKANRQARLDIERVLGLPFEQVKQQALHLLSDSKRFRVLQAESSTPIDNVGPILQEFFCTFDSVEELNGDFFVSRQAVAESAFRPGFIKIGTDFEHSELVVKPGEAWVFIVTDAYHRLDGLPTIYHNICLLE